MKTVKPVNEQKLRELEKELEVQKKRFFEATQQAVETVKEQASVWNWVREYPLQTAAALFLGGFFFTQTVSSQRKLESKASIPRKIR